MPPKAKAKAKAKGKAFARPAARAVVRGAARRRGAPRPGLRRPAAAVPGGVEDTEDFVEKFNRGEVVNAEAVSGLVFTPGLLVAIEGSYWQGDVQAAGVVKVFRQEGEQKEIDIQLTGTTSERLLKWGSGHKGSLLKVHLCPVGCPAEDVADDYLHCRRIRRVLESEKMPWMSCLEDGLVDELRELREGIKDAEDKKAPKRKKAERSESTSPEKKKKKRKKEKKKKEKKEEKIEKRKENASSSSGRPKGSKPLGRIKGQADLGKVYGGTGLDPNPDVRRRIKRRVRRSLKKKKEKDSTGSSSVSDSTSDSHSNEGIFPEGRRVREVARKAPGALASQSIEEMKEQLLTASGQMWSLDSDGPVPPLAVHYYRTVMRPRMSGGLAREGLTVAYILDLGLQGRMAEAMDVAVQRLKSLELSSSGTDFRISQRIELAPLEQEAVASSAERRQALLEAKEESRLKFQTGKGGDWNRESWKGGKGQWEQRDGGKGKKGKKGDFGGHEPREDPRKGDKEREWRLTL